MSVSMRLEGGADLETALRSLKRASAKAVARRALAAGGAPIASAAAERAPELTGNLKAHIFVSSRGGADAGRSAYGAALRAGADVAGARAAARSANRGAAGNLVEMFVGPARAVAHAGFQEFGTGEVTAQPYMRPAWDAEKLTALRIIQETMEREVARAVERAARKAARAAARGRG